MGARGKAVMANEVRPCGVPRRSFGFFPIAGKETRPAGRNPVRRRAPKRKSETYPLIRPLRGTYPYPLCRFATSPLDKGSRPPEGKAFFGGDAPSPAPQGGALQNRPAAKIPPQGKPFAFFLQLCYNNSKMPDYALIWRYPCPTFKY